MSGVDIVLVNPGSQRQLYGVLSAFNLAGIEPPLWGALLAAYLRAEVEAFILEMRTRNPKRRHLSQDGRRPMEAR